jgi:hypothetical protein
MSPASDVRGIGIAVSSPKHLPSSSSYPLDLSGLGGTTGSNATAGFALRVTGTHKLLHNCMMDLQVECLEHSTFQKTKTNLRKTIRVFIILITTVILKIICPLFSLRKYVENFHSIHVHIGSTNVTSRSCCDSIGIYTGNAIELQIGQIPNHPECRLAGTCKF